MEVGLVNGSQEHKLLCATLAITSEKSSFKNYQATSLV